MPKAIKYTQKARSELLRGLEKLYDVVSVTFGPQGNNVMLDTKFTPLVLNDGYLIARQIDFANRFEQMGAQLALEVARNTNDDVGDGTTSAIIIAANMLIEANRLLNSGMSSHALKNNLLAFKTMMLEILHTKSRSLTSLDDLEQVATIASKDANVGHLIRQIYEQLNHNVAIVVEEGIEEGLKFVIEKGIVIERGYMSKFMVSDYIHKKTILKKANVVIVGEKYDMANLLNISDLPLLLIFSNITSDDLHVLNKYIIGSKRQVVAIKKDEVDEKLDDLRVLCQMVPEDGHLIGCAREVIVTKNKTTIINNYQDEEYIAELTNELEGQDDYKRSLWQQRIASLSGGVAKIIVGCHSEIELQELKARIEDAINATQTASQYGLSLGEGIGYLEIIEELRKKDLNHSMQKTFEMIECALVKPYQLILENADLDTRSNQPYDFNTNQFVARQNFHVYDPTKVLESVICNAISVTCMFISTAVVIADLSNNPEPFEI